MKKIYSFLALAWLFMAQVAIAQPYQVVGSANAVTPGFEYQVTPDLPEQSGAVWSQTKLNLNFNFKIITQLNFGFGNSPGADGMAFVLQPISSDQGNTGGQIGYGSIAPSFIVEFDTYQNSSPGDPSVGNGDPQFSIDHIAFSRDGSVEHNISDPVTGPNPPHRYEIPYPSPYTFTTNPSTPTGIEFEDGQWHDAVFEWDATTKVFKVTFDNNPSLSLTYDLTNQIFSGDPMVYWGITGGTGAEHNDQRFRIKPLTLLNITKTDIKCYGNKDGTATLNVTGGLAPFTYTLNGPVSVTNEPFTSSTSTVITNLAPGSYTVTVTDAANTTTASSSFTINQFVTPLVATISDVKAAKCNNTATGSLKITPAGGTAPYTLTGTGLPEAGVPITASGLTLNNLAAGDYTFVVTDANGCVDDAEAEITEPTLLVAGSKDMKPACNGNNGSVTITATGGTAPYTGTGIKSNLAPGTQTFIVSDVNGCTSSVTVTIGGTGPGSFNPASETFPNQFNTGLTKSLVNKTFVGSQGTWTANSNAYGSIAVLTPYYSPSSSYALKILNFKTSGCSYAGSSSATSPKLNLTGPCCPNDLKLNFTLWTYTCVSGDTKASLDIDFSKDGGATWTEVWSQTSAQLFTAYGANGKTSINIAIPVEYQNANFKYRFRGDMAANDANNFYVFIDDIKVMATSSCSSPGSIGDFVWKDVNGDGKQNSGEPGIANVTVKLTYPNNTTAVKTTDANGKYTFDNLVAGNYTVTFTTPSGYTPTSANVGSDDNIDSDPVNGVVAVTLASGENKTNVDAGFKVPACTNTTQHTETFPYQFNTGFTKSLSNKTFTGSSGTWTANSNACATITVLQPYYSPSTSYALKIVNFKTTTSAGSCSATSPKINITGSCCPAEQKLSFTLWTYSVAATDTKAALEIDFSKDGGTTWTEVWSKTSADLYALSGANGKTNISIPIASTYQTSLFRYRIRGEMAKSDANNFYLFIDDISIKSPASCTTTRTAQDAVVVKAPIEQKLEAPKVIEELVIDNLSAVAMPNPTRTDFRIELKGKTGLPVTIRLMDVSGRLIKTFSELPSSYTLRFGSDLKKGSYFAEVIQGEERKILKLVKL